MILENRDKSVKVDFFDSEKTDTPQESSLGQLKNAGRRVFHPKYGEGSIESEDEDTIAVVFGQYGLKIFSKDFCPLEFPQGTR